MTTSAIIFMIFSMILIWGGLIVATIHLIRNPDIPMNQISKD